jgi:hypothetical protein
MSNENNSEWRWVLFASNAFAIPATLVAWRNIQAMWLEFYFYLSIMVYSTFNHLCWSYHHGGAGDDGLLQGIPCGAWHRLDTFFSNGAIIATMIWIAFPLGDVRRYAVTVLLLVLPATGAAYGEPLSADGVSYYMLVLAVPYFCAMLLLGFWRNLYPRGIVGSLAFAGLAAAGLALGDGQAEHYVAFHSLWHTFIFTSLYVIVSARKGQRPSSNTAPLIAGMLGGGGAGAGGGNTRHGSRHRASMARGLVRERTRAV